MGRYVKKPVVIDADQWNPGDPKCVERVLSIPSAFLLEGNLMIATLEGVMEAKPGDWIIRGIKGEYYPCKPEIFEASYEPYEDSESYK